MKFKLTEGDSVQKEELLHLHMLLIHVKKYYENVTSETIFTDRYNSLSISPVHIHKNKILHKRAILTLGEEIVHHLRLGHGPVVEYRADTTPESVAVHH